MIQYRRLAALILGAWLGGSIFADIAVTQNFATVDRFLAAPGSTSASIELGKIGRDRLRVLLRRNAGEENNYIFENWERAEFAIAIVLLTVLAFGGRPDKPMLALNVLMLAVIAVQHFLLSPQITDLGRRIADIPAALLQQDPLNARFWMLHGFYSGSEILKLVLGLVLGGRLCPLRKQGPLDVRHG